MNELELKLEFITESQFIEGCKSDETFVKIFSEPNTDFILGFSDD